MRKYIIKTLLLILSLSVVLSSGFKEDTVLMAIFIVIVSGSLSLIHDNQIRTAIILIYGLLGMVFPPLNWGLLVIALDFDVIWFLLLLIVPLLKLQSMEALFIVIGSIVSYYVHYLEMMNQDTTLKIIDLEMKQESTSINQALVTQQRIQQQKDDLELIKLNERNRIAHDIHDNVGHLLSSAIIQVGALQAINKDEKLTPHHDVLKDTLDRGMNSIRKSVHELYADAFSLQQEIQRLIDGLPKLDVRFDYRIETQPNQAIKNALLSILKEALNNTLKHSNSHKVSIKIDESFDNYYCIIQDGGTVNRQIALTGLGLSSIEKRVSALNGICNIQTDNGYRIYINIPKETV